MSDIAITFTVAGVMIVLFISNRVPVAPVALSGALVLFATGVLDLQETLGGFGDSAVLFIASLFVVSAALQTSGVAAWAGQRLVRKAGESRTRLVLLTMLMVAGMTALIGTGGAVAALLPVVVLAAVRLHVAPSQLMMPLAFGAHAGSMLMLTGSLVNVLVSDAATDIGLAPFGFFEPALIGVPLLAGAIVITVLFGERLLPTRGGRGLPPDLSRHSRTLAADYQIAEGMHELEIAPGSAYSGMARLATEKLMERQNRPDLSFIAIRPRSARAAVLGAGDRILMRGDAAAVAAFAQEKGLVPSAEPPELQQTLFNSTSGLAEVVLPPRSGLIGERVFAGMVTESGDLMILGVQRRGAPLPPGEVTLAAGDTLLLQGGWDALERHIRDPDVLVVTPPEAIRSQAIPFGAGSRRAVLIVAVMIAAMASGAVPNVIAGLVAACAAVLVGVLTLEQAYRAVKLNSLIMIAAMIPLATAMYKTGAAYVLADLLVETIGGASPVALLAALFALAALLAQVASSTASALIVIPVAVAAAVATGVPPQGALMAVAVGATSCYLTPIASSACLMVQGPGGYRFGDYWKLGLPLMLWAFLVAIVLVPIFWPVNR